MLTKRRRPSQLKTSTQLIAMINSLPRDKEQPFGCSRIHFARAFRKRRTKVAAKLKNECICKIHFHNLRQWKATTEYAKTKDILYVMKILVYKISKTCCSALSSSISRTINSTQQQRISSTLRNWSRRDFECVCDFGELKLFTRRK